MQLRSLLVASLATAIAFAGAAGADELREPRTFRVWLKEGVMADPLSESIDGHPCGGVSYRRAATVPAEDAYVVPEFVREYDASGELLREWRVPVDTSVYAIRGEHILVSDNYESLWIDLDGRVREVPLTHRAIGIGEPHDCPMDSCVSFADADDQRVRRLGFNAICS